MALRLMQILVPEESGDEVTDLLAERELLGLWKETGPERRWLIQLLVPADEAGPVMDQLEQRFSGRTGFRLMLLPVEAVLPRPPAPEAPAAHGPIKKTKGISREELYHEVSESVDQSRRFIVMTMLSTVVAAVGLMRDDLAVIIGAMVIAPLLGPQVATALATTLADWPLARRALRTNILGVGLTLFLSVLVGITFNVDPQTPAIAARTQVNLTDVTIALASGAAATLAFTSAAPAALIGVMVAVALMPPLVCMGMLLGAGHMGAAGNAFLLTMVNVICVNLAGVAMFLYQGVGPRVWWESAKARRAAWYAALLWSAMLMVLLFFLTLEAKSAV